MRLNQKVGDIAGPQLNVEKLVQAIENSKKYLELIFKLTHSSCNASPMSS